MCAPFTNLDRCHHAKLKGVSFCLLQETGQTSSRASNGPRHSFVSTLAALFKPDIPFAQQVSRAGGHGRGKSIAATEPEAATRNLNSGTAEKEKEKEKESST